MKQLLKWFKVVGQYGLVLMLFGSPELICKTEVYNISSEAIRKLRIGISSISFWCSMGGVIAFVTIPMREVVMIKRR